MIIKKIAFGILLTTSIVTYSMESVSNKKALQTSPVSQQKNELTNFLAVVCKKVKHGIYVHHLTPKGILSDIIFFVGGNWKRYFSEIDFSS